MHAGLIFGFAMHTEEGLTGPDKFTRSVNVWINLSPEAILTGAYVLLCNQWMCVVENDVQSNHQSYPLTPLAPSLLLNNDSDFAHPHLRLLLRERPAPLPQAARPGAY